MKSSILTAAIFAVAALQAQGQATLIFDQQSATSGTSLLAPNADGLRIQNGTYTQSFIPSLSSIGFVQLEFWDIPLNTDLWFREGIVVPEPSALAFFGVGGFLFLVRKRFRVCLQRHYFW